MISGGNATVFVSDLETAVRFYTETLGLELFERYENDWAAVRAGALVIGLHPNMDGVPRSGSHGAITIGLDIQGQLEEVVEALEERGVVFTRPIMEDPISPARLAFFEDPDGNTLYLLELNIR